MKSARSASSAFGIVAGAAIVTSSVGLLGGTAAEASTANAADVSAVGASAPSVCGQPPAATSAVRTVPSGKSAIVLDAASVSSSSSPSPSPSATATASATAKTTNSATPSSTGSATSTPQTTSSATATPSSSASSSPSTSPSSSPSGSASPSPSPTGTGSKSPSPSPSPTGSSPSVQLCLKVQPITTKAGVHPGGTASFAIWVWPAGGAASGVSVTISSKAGSKQVTPKFTVCPTVSAQTCKVGGIAKGTSDELQATATVPSSTAVGKDITLTATAKASDATAPPAAAAAIKITAKPSSKHSPSPTPTPASSSPSTGSGIGATLPPGILPTVPLTTTQGATLGELPGPTTSAGSPGGLFPTVSPQPSASPSPYSAVLPNARNVRVTDDAATFPFSTRLIGGELVGLAVLAAALAIAIVRFSLRRPRPQHGKDAAS